MLPLDQSPAQSALGPLGTPARIRISLTTGATAEEERAWTAAGQEHDQLDQLASAVPDGLQHVRVTAWRNDSDSVSSSLVFCVSPNAALRGLMVDWCSRQGIDLADVCFRMESQRELAPLDTLCGLLGATLPQEDVIDIRADPKSTTQPVQPDALKLPDMQIPAKEVKEVKVGPREVAPKPSVPRVQVRVAAQNILSERLKSEAGLSFWTKLYAPLSKVIAAWCKHHGLAADTVVIFCKGKAVDGSDTPATHGWAAGAEVTLEAFHISDPLAQTRASESASTGQEQPDQDRPGRVLCKVYDNEECLEFWMRPSTAFHRMMTAWRQHRQRKPQHLRFELTNKDAQGLRAGDIASDETPASRGWSPGLAPASDFIRSIGVVKVLSWPFCLLTFTAFTCIAQVLMVHVHSVSSSADAARCCAPCLLSFRLGLA